MGSDTGDGWCVECGDYFHLDDCGGYNPPCHKCGLCQGCCECDEAMYDEYGPDDGLDSEEREALGRLSGVPAQHRMSEQHEGTRETCRCRNCTDWREGRAYILYGDGTKELATATWRDTMRARIRHILDDLPLPRDRNRADWNATFESMTDRLMRLLAAGDEPPTEKP